MLTETNLAFPDFKADRHFISFLLDYCLVVAVEPEYQDSLESYASESLFFIKVTHARHIKRQRCGKSTFKLIC